MCPEIASDIEAFIREIRRVWPDYNALLSENAIFIKRTADVGVIPREKAIGWGLTGPSLRGSGVRFDLRKARPYSFYERFEFDVPVGAGEKGTLGDCWDRYWVRMLEIIESARIVEQALGGLPEGPVAGKVPKTIKPPHGEVYVPCENPRGELGFYMIGDGRAGLLRCRARGPSFCNLSITNEISRDVLVADVVAIIGSVDIVLGEVDR